MVKKELYGSDLGFIMSWVILIIVFFFVKFGYLIMILVVIKVLFCKGENDGRLW